MFMEVVYRFQPWHGMMNTENSLLISFNLKEKSALE